MVAWYWCTRDRNDDGELSGWVNVWSETPQRWRDPKTGAVLWWCDSKTAGRWPFRVDVVQRWCGTIPDTDLECLRVPGIRGEDLRRNRRVGQGVAGA